ncbi:hypothetical protein [Gardnerella swidsinskii]|uniref:hypothetical protein n=1 Tax=Gardnerella swidsinskii TaxID=2792979 RepID=UPI000E2FDF15|nr:hypothetical protein [Gardnerella swidsinskii]NSX39351.1 hypothetical protein [Gardnerella vaginalis]
MSNIYTVFASTCIRRFNHNILRELVTGIFVSIILTIFAWFYPEWLIFFLWFYCYLIQVISVHTNTVFLNEHDLDIFHIHSGSIRFHILYIIHYVLRDMYYANIVCLSILAISLSLLGKFSYFVCFLVSYLLNLLIIPAQIFFSSRLTAKARTIWLIGLLLPILLLVVFQIAGSYTLFSSIYTTTAILPFIALIYCLILYYTGHKIKVRFGTRCNARKYWSWIRTFSVMLFRDVLLQRQRILLASLSQLSILILLSIGTNLGNAAFPLIIFTICQTNIVMTRNQGKLYLLTDDHQFSYTRFPLDSHHLLRGKLLILAINIPIVSIIAICFLLAFDNFNLHDIVFLELLLLTNFVIDTTCITESDLLIRTLRALVKYLTSAVVICTWFMKAPDWVPLIFLTITILLYLPTVNSCYQFGRCKIKKGNRQHYEL